MNDFSFNRKIKFDISGNPIINANILPSTTLSYDLGSPDKRWRDIYLSGNTIDLDGTKIQKEVGGGIKIADASGNTLDGKFNNLDISGNIIAAGNIIGNLIPNTNLAYDLGAPDKRWNDLYLSGNTIDLSGTLLSRHTDGSLMVHDSNNNMISGRFNHVIAEGDVTCDNLNVNGTTTTINSTTVTVQDPIITLGSDTTNTKDKGIEFKYGTSKIGFFGYDDSTGNLTFLKDASNNSEVFSGTQGTIEGSTFKSTVVNGIAPLAVTSSTLVTNLNADLLDGLNPSQFMRTDANTSTTGNVGIGIASPATKLQVQSTSITTGLSIQNADVHTILGNTAGVTNSGSIQVKAAGSSSTIGTTNYNLCLNPDGGNVIIGGTSSLSRLTVKNSYGDGQNGGICIDATDGSVYNMRIYSYVQGAAQVGYAFKVNNIGSSTDAICLGYNGNVGIGITNPTATLHVNGSIKNTNPCFQVYRDGTIVPAGSTIIFQEVYVNRGNGYNNTNGLFTAPIAGIYQMNFHGMKTTDGLYPAIYLRKNGSNYVAGHGTTGLYAHVTLSCIIDLNVNDYVDIFNVNGYSVLHPGIWTCFSGNYIG